MLDPHERRAGREQRVADANPPGIERVPVCPLEILEPLDGLDPPPPVPACESGVAGSPGLARRRPSAGLLGQDARSAQDGATFGFAFRSGAVLRHTERLGQSLGEDDIRLETGRTSKLEFGRGWHGVGLAEELRRALGDEWRSVDEAWFGPEPGPLGTPADEADGDGIRE